VSKSAKVVLGTISKLPCSSLRASTRVEQSAVLRKVRGCWRSCFAKLRLAAANSKARSVAAIVFAALACSACAQGDGRCLEAAALWIPSDTGLSRIVTKWRGPVSYGILPRDDIADAGYLLTKRLIEATLSFFGKASGLTIKADQGPNPDLVVLVLRDIATAAPALRKSVEELMSSTLSARNIDQHLEIGPAWDAKIRAGRPRCIGIHLFIGGEIVRGLGVIEPDETEECINVGLGELFGLSNIRKYYLDHDSHVPKDLITAALQSLYDKRIPVHIGPAEAAQRLEETCK
jgi:hypothetical protein